MYIFGPDKSPTVSCWLLTTEDQVHSQGSPCGIYDGQSGTGTSFSRSPSVFPVNITPLLLHIHLYYLGDEQLAC
jgi:hypothetical protein